jgi:cob(I)alamin adenosyltransferase
MAACRSTEARGRSPIIDTFTAREQGQMGHRLSKIYTRTGDAGTTGLGDGKRVSKDSPRIHTLGEIDELNASIGVLLCEELPDDVRALLTDVQHDLFDLGGEVCIPGMSMITGAQVDKLETTLDGFNEPLEPLKDFILPGGTRPAALAHQSRTICRRAERALVTLALDEAVNDGPRQYLNRLSDLLFVLGRVLNRAGGRGDVLWQKGKNA